MKKEIDYLSLSDFDDFEIIRKNLAKTDKLCAHAYSHVKNMHLVGCSILNPESPCLLNIIDDGYVPPTKLQLQRVIFYLNKMGLTKNDISNRLGLSSNGNRTLNYWLAESRDQRIPYTAWRLLLSLAGLSIDLIVLSEKAEKIVEMKAKQLSEAEEESFDL